MRKEIIIKDKRLLENPDEYVAFPNDYVDKYIKLFNKEQMEAVVDLIKQTYNIGLQIGRQSEKSKCDKQLDEIYK